MASASPVCRDLGAVSAAALMTSLGTNFAHAAGSDTIRFTLAAN